MYKCSSGGGCLKKGREKRTSILVKKGLDELVSFNIVASTTISPSLGPSRFRIQLALPRRPRVQRNIYLDELAVLGGFIGGDQARRRLCLCRVPGGGGIR